MAISCATGCVIPRRHLPDCADDRMCGGCLPASASDGLNVAFRCALCRASPLQAAPLRSGPAHEFLDDRFYDVFAGQRPVSLCRGTPATNRHGDSRAAPPLQCQGLRFAPLHLGFAQGCTPGSDGDRGQWVAHGV
jgi:hypothetical protein